MFSKGDIVAVCGAVITDTKIKKSLKLVTVLEVGLYDLIVESTGGYFKDHLRVPKSRCTKIHLKWSELESPKPSIGDLVMYYEKKYDGKIEKEIGHLYEIEYPPGKDAIATISHGKEMKTAPMQHLIILEKRDV